MLLKQPKIMRTIAVLSVFCALGCLRAANGHAASDAQPQLAVTSSKSELIDGVDYYAADQFHLPEYSLSRNLVQNPGFEQGLRYWSCFGFNGKLTESHDYYQAVSDAPFEGRQCLKIQGVKGQQPAPITSFAIPVETGATYTISFYARGDHSGAGLVAGGITAAMHTGGVWGGFRLSPKWKRYSISFKAPNGAVSLAFSVGPEQNCVAWVDAVQLEKGTMTDYTAKPLSTNLLTSRQNNLFQPGEKVNAHMDILGHPGTRGSLTLTMTDFFGKTVHREKSTFTVGAGGIASQGLPWMEGLPPGLYLIESDFRSDDGFADRDYFRLAIMRFQDNTAKHKNLFAFGSWSDRAGNWAGILDFFKKLGIGSCISGGDGGMTPWTHGFSQLAAADNITTVSSIFDDFGGVSGKLDIKNDYAKLTDADLQTVEENAYQRAKEFPEVKYWKLVNEPGSAQDDIEMMKLFIRPLAAARRGILRANPQAIILSPDPPHMAPQSGIHWMDTFLSAGGKAVCDVIAIHPYRANPEEPDLDADTAALLAMLARHHYNGDVWFTEGGGNYFMNVPVFGLDVYHALSQEHQHWGIGRLTYDMGWGERVEAAYAMRYWLVGLKYANRIKQQVLWYFPQDAFLDYDLTPGAEAFAPNVLSQLLGDSTYRQDVALGLNTRCYVFQDGEKRPVAALWSYDPKVDRGETSGPVLDISKLPPDVELIDFMGRTVKRQATLQLSSFPCFLRGKQGTLATFVKTLENGQISGNAHQVVTYAQIVSAGRAEVRLQNLLARPAAGHVRVALNGKTLRDAAITVPGSGMWKLPVALPENQDLLQQFPLEISFQPVGGQAQVTKVNLETLVSHYITKPPVIDGDLSGWPVNDSLALPLNFIGFNAGIDPSPPWSGPADLSGTLYTAWDAQNFYLAVKVRDNVFHPANTLDSVWQGDSLQIYFDSWNNARAEAAKGLQGFDGDDQAFDVWPSPQGVQVQRSVAPDVQLAFLKTGLVPDVKSAFKRTADGYVIEMALPAREIVPLPLKPGTVLGFAVLINDNDGQGRKRGLTLTPSGTEPYLHPDLYPTMILDAAP